MSSNIAAPYKTLFNFGNIDIFEFTCTSPKLWLENQKLATWLIWLSSIHFWSSGICYLRGFCGGMASRKNNQFGVIQESKVKPIIWCALQTHGWGSDCSLAHCGEPVAVCERGATVQDRGVPQYSGLAGALWRYDAKAQYLFIKTTFQPSIDLILTHSFKTVYFEILYVWIFLFF